MPSQLMLWFAAGSVCPQQRPRGDRADDSGAGSSVCLGFQGWLPRQSACSLPEPSSLPVFPSERQFSFFAKKKKKNLSAALCKPECLSHLLLPPQNGKTPSAASAGNAFASHGSSGSSSPARGSRCDPKGLLRHPLARCAELSSLSQAVLHPRGQRRCPLPGALGRVAQAVWGLQGSSWFVEQRHKALRLLTDPRDLPIAQVSG